MGFKKLSIAGLAIVASLAFAAPAGATITKTHITTPAKSPTYFTYNENSPNTFKVSGTTNSTSPSTDTVDILCFYGDSGQYDTVASGVTLGSHGSFSVPAAPLNTVYDGECQLAAVPSGLTKIGSGFTGPRIEVGERQVYPISGGPNNGKLYDYYVWGQQTAVADDYDSISSCGFCDSYLLDNTGGLTSIVFYGNAWFNYGNENGTGNTRSDIQVDGRDAYMGYSANQVFAGSNQEHGFPTVTYHVSQNSSTGDVTITETDQIARCKGSPPYPPTSTTCPSFKPTGVEVKRKMVQNASGQMVWITDSFKSTDGHAHTLDLLYDNAQCLQASSCTASNVGYRFPGQHAYRSHAPGDVLHVRKGIASAYVDVLGAPDGDPYTGQAAITWGQAPTKVLFVNPAFSVDSNFTMHYAGKVPAKGSLTYRFVYSTAYTYAAVHRDALAAQHALNAGKMADVQAGAGRVLAPVDGSTTRSGRPRHGHR